MYIPFENLPGESRVWIYQSNRKFSEEEFSEIETDLKAFVEQMGCARHKSRSFIFVKIQ